MSYLYNIVTYNISLNEKQTRNAIIKNALLEIYKAEKKGKNPSFLPLYL